MPGELLTSDNLMIQKQSLERQELDVSIKFVLMIVSLKDTLILFSISPAVN